MGKKFMVVFQVKSTRDSSHDIESSTSKCVTWPEAQTS